MASPLSPSAWLADSPMQPDEQLYVVMGSASEAKPFAAWQTVAGAKPPQPVWAGTPYAGWNEVMPYVGVVEPGSAFLDWVTNTRAVDWGWLAVSSCPQEVVLNHLKGLTQVYLPEDQPVFLRFWDGTQFLPMLQHLGDDAATMLPVFQRYLINGQSLAVSPCPLAATKPSPWWRVPAPLLAHLAQQSPQVLIDNLLQWLQEQRPDLYTAFSPAILQHKVAYFVRRPGIGHAELADYLAAQLS